MPAPGLSMAPVVCIGLRRVAGRVRFQSYMTAVQHFALLPQAGSNRAAAAVVASVGSAPGAHRFACWTRSLHPLPKHACRWKMGIFLSMPAGCRYLHMERLLEGVERRSDIAAQRDELQRAVGSRPPGADSYSAEQRDEDLALGSMASSALGGPRDADLALECFTRVWESGEEARSASAPGGTVHEDVNLSLQLALLHLEDDGVKDEETVRALLDGRDEDAPPGGASRKHGGGEVTEEKAKAVIKDIRSLQRQVRAPLLARWLQRLAC
jgi:hypothetical protein